MREILFRGKRADNGEWVYGGYIHAETMDKHYIIVHDGSKVFDVSCFDFYEVIPETVGEYTGIYTGGDMIFEGDICRASRGKDIDVGEIVYKDKCGIWLIVYDSIYCNALHDFTTSDDYNVWIKVIGNIHDTPELLEAEG